MDQKNAKSSKYSRDDLIEAAKVASEKTGGPVSRREFQRISGISSYHIYKLFPEGGWREILDLAGVSLHPRDTKRMDDSELLAHFHSVVCELGRIPTWYLFRDLSDISCDVVQKRFGGMQGTLKKYRDWLQKNHPESPFLDMLQVKSKHETPVLRVEEARSSQNIIDWEKKDIQEYGAPINFRGLRHAPINEQGVVYLFGMVSYELGLIVEAIQSQYPDCEAKRCVDHKRDRWQRVKIEFEFRSKNFLAHGHDPQGCDLIVCWEHDWEACPIEVIELRTVIDELDG